MKDVNDIARIQYVLDNYDSMERGGKAAAYTTTKEKGRQGLADTVMYIKAVNGTYYVVEAVPNTKAKTNYIVSAYMSKTGINKTGTQYPAHATSGPASATSENADTDAPATFIISQTQQNGNINYPQGTGAAESGFVPKTAPVSADTANSRTGTSIAQEMLRRTQQREL